MSRHGRYFGLVRIISSNELADLVVLEPFDVGATSVLWHAAV